MSKQHIFRSGQNINPAEKLICSDHDEPFIFYCVDCDSVVCKRCAVKKHNRHNMSEINESVLELKAQLAQCVESSVKDLMNDIEHLQEEKRGYKSENKSLIMAINKDAKLMKDLIDQKSEELINSIKKNEKKNLKIMSTAYSELKDTFDRVDKIQMSIIDTAKLSDVALLLKIKQLQAKNDKIEKKKVPYILKDRYSRKEITQNEIGKLFGELYSRKTPKKTQTNYRQEERKYRCFTELRGYSNEDLKKTSKENQHRYSYKDGKTDSEETDSSEERHSNDSSFSLISQISSEWD
ncbi:unnamed protein product [Mytilus coruscus]|uniref:B box-type domain-containing protein n=1 Tax=Mytilus coruscus TaxID=42192 RepID=A0A6J8B9Q6_MYTCO|nr:unnamed protein product [Mytilus coruscus]